MAGLMAGSLLLLAVAPPGAEYEERLKRLDYAERLAAAAMLEPVRPSQARQLLADARPIAQGDPEAAGTLIRFLASRGDWEAAASVSREVAQNGMVTLNATGELLRSLSDTNGRLAAELGSAVIAAFPRPLLAPGQRRFLAAQLPVLAKIDPALAVQAAEALVSAGPSDRELESAGAYLAVYDRAQFSRMARFDGVRRSLSGLTPADLPQVGERPLPWAPVLKTGWEPFLAALKRYHRDLIPLERFPGKVVMLHMWASWCLPCRAEVPALRAVGARYAGDLVMAASTDEADMRLDGFAAVPDPDHRIRDGYEVGSLPVTLIFGRDGRLAARRNGQQTEAELIDALAPLVREP